MDNHNMTNLVFTDEANLTFTFLVFVFLKKKPKNLVSFVSGFQSQKLFCILSLFISYIYTSTNF